MENVALPSNASRVLSLCDREVTRKTGNDILLVLSYRLTRHAIDTSNSFSIVPRLIPIKHLYSLRKGSIYLVRRLRKIKREPD